MAGEVVDDHTVVGRAMALIEAVAICGPRVTLAELAAVSGIPKPTVLRIATGLVSRQLLTRTDGGYSLGPELSRLGEKAALQRDFERYVPVMEDLHAAYGGIAWMAAGRELEDVAPVVRVSDPEFVVLARHGWPAPGSVAMLTSTALGHLALAQQPELFERVARRPMAPSAPNAPRDVRQLFASVQRARQEGFAVESEQSTPGWSCVAAPLPTTTDTKAVIGVTLPVGRANAREIIRAVLRAFDAVAADIGPLHRPSS
ncbi:IclR family transcriptional regulator [Mycobacterium sp. URHB0044]|uniref:IclR family transcriptional regulator n=1 Tax=Mycobacterium sp. URHB0044 TaxID=1380386 RepID=UPI0004910E0B|nr:helix-turn-helix domain-containing protein [Mycobacterium sp. URHB0044]